MRLPPVESEPFIVGGVLLLVAAVVGVSNTHFLSVAHAVSRHVGRHWKQATVVTRPVPNWERVNLFLALEALREATPGSPRVLGMGYFNDILLQPALVVIEDVDLIAADRTQSIDTMLLHDLMDEMDGLGPKADVIFLLTTNRPRMLETALAARPGRVDQAVYFPLPDRDCRRRLFAHFAAGLDLSAVDVEPLLDRTDGASPAFIAELFRKAALMAAERGEKSDPLKLTSADFHAAVRELVEFGGVLTQQLLGYCSDPDSGRGNLGFSPRP